MEKQNKILFGIDDSDFAMQALTEVARLLQHREDIQLTLFHGVPDPDIALLSKLFGPDADKIESHRALWVANARKSLARAAETLTRSGIDSDRLSTVFEESCNDPAGAILKLADAQGFDTIAVGRWGKTTVSRQIIGSVTYRLAHLAHNRALWVIDPRICSHDVLVGIVGAPISRRVLDYAVRHFAHLKESRFTFLHVISPVPPQLWESEGIPPKGGNELEPKIAAWLKEYTDKVKAIAGDAKEALVAAGVPEQNVTFKFQPLKTGIARDILLEMEEGNHGILVIGRKGYKDIREFGMGSKANKLLIAGRAFVICLVS
ncbi:MAG TPA: universal stress protein [Desulfobacterales bacterium]